MAMEVNPQDLVFNPFELDEEKIMEQFKHLPLPQEPAVEIVTNFVTPGESVVSYPDHFNLG